MGFGGIIAGAMGGAAGQAVDIADKQIDFNNKQTMAKFASDLEVDRNAQAQRLGQTISQENTKFGLSPEITAASDAAAASRQRSTAITAAAPDVLDATNKVEASKPREIPFGGEFHQNVNGVDTVLGKNKTPLDEFRYPRSGGAGGSAADKKTLFDLKDAHQGLSETTTDAEKLYKDPVTGAAPGAVVSYATSAYQRYLRAEGGNPIDARVKAGEDTAALVTTAKSVMKSAKYKDQVKGDFDQALSIARGLMEPAAPAEPKPTAKGGASESPPKAPTGKMDTPAPAAPAPAPAAPGLLAGARAAPSRISAMDLPSLMALASGPRQASPADVSAARDELKRRMGAGGASAGSTELANGD